jgi:hypothetical protein
LWAQAVEINPVSASGQSRTQYTITVRNLGNTPAAYRLAVVPTRSNLTCALDHHHVPLDVRQSGSVRLTVTAARRWVGKPQERIFNVRSERMVADSSRAHNDSDRAEEISATFIHNALFTPIALVLLLVGLVGSALTRRWWPLVLTAVGLFLAFRPYRRESKALKPLMNSEKAD